MLKARIWLFHDGGRYHIETSPLICSANQWAGFYTITASVMTELSQSILQDIQRDEVEITRWITFPDNWISFFKFLNKNKTSSFF